MVETVLTWGRTVAFVIVGIAIAGVLLLTFTTWLGSRSGKVRARQEALRVRLAETDPTADLEFFAMLEDDGKPLGHDRPPTTGPRNGEGWKTASRYGASES
jgi:hypothetical protein